MEAVPRIGDRFVDEENIDEDTQRYTVAEVTWVAPRVSDGTAYEFSGISWVEIRLKY